MPCEVVMVGSRASILVGADRQPPVEQVDLVEGADHHVGRFDVSVDDAAAVSEPEGLADLHEDADVPVDRVPDAVAFGDQVGLGDELAPGHALDALEHDERAPIVIDRNVVDGDDVRVLELPGDEGFLEQGSRRHLRRLDRLDGDLPSHAVLLADVHHAHAPFADDVADLEAPLEPARRGGWGERGGDPHRARQRQRIVEGGRRLARQLPEATLQLGLPVEALLEVDERILVELAAEEAAEEHRVGALFDGVVQSVSSREPGVPAVEDYACHHGLSTARPGSARRARWP